MLSWQHTIYVIDSYETLILIPDRIGRMFLSLTVINTQ